MDSNRIRKSLSAKLCIGVSLIAVLSFLAGAGAFYWHSKRYGKSIGLTNDHVYFLFLKSQMATLFSTFAVVLPLMMIISCLFIYSNVRAEIKK